MNGKKTSDKKLSLNKMILWFAHVCVRRVRILCACMRLVNANRAESIKCIYKYYVTCDKERKFEYNLEKEWHHPGNENSSFSVQQNAYHGNIYDLNAIRVAIGTLFSLGKLHFVLINRGNWQSRQWRLYLLYYINWNFEKNVVV